MALEFHSLEGFSIDTLCATFNEAFSDYLIPLQLTSALLEQKMNAEQIWPENSIGVSENGVLCGFILHGTDHLTSPGVLYNGGTGVIPAARGRRLVQQMYDHALPGYRSVGIKEVLLEVITGNEPAIRAYRGTGFRERRLLHSFRGEPVAPLSMPPGIGIEEARSPDPSWKAFADQEPSWSNTFDAIRREAAATRTLVAKDGAHVLGFVSVNIPFRRIRQIAVAKEARGKGIGGLLLQQAALLAPGPLSLINVEEGNRELCRFLEAAGLRLYLSQYEMVLDL